MKDYKIFAKLSLLSLSLLAICSCGSSQTTSEEKTTSLITSSTTSEEPRDVKVILMCGQSNMEGKSFVYCLQEKVSEEKFLEYSNGYESPKIAYRLSLASTRKKFGNTSFNGFPGLGFGPELGLAEYLNEVGLEKDVYLIKHAYGGTGIHPNTSSHTWTPPSYKDGTKTGDLFLDLIEFVHQEFQELEKKNLKPSIAGFLWMQGEADADHIDATNDYKELESKMFDDFEKAFEQYLPNEHMPCIDAAISNGINGKTGKATWPYHVQVNNAKKEIAEENPSYRFYIDTNAEGLRCDQERSNSSTDIDYAHYDSLSMLKLGRLYGEVIHENGLLDY